MPDRSTARFRHLQALGVVGACTALAALMDHDFERANLTMVYLLGVVVTAMAFGRGPAITAAIASVATFDFVFVPPRWTFRVSDAQYLVTFAVMLIVAVVIGTLTARLREESERAHERERRAAGLQRLGAALSRGEGAIPMLVTAASVVSELVGSRVVFLVRDDGGALRPVAGATELLSDPDENAAARQASETMLPVGAFGNENAAGGLIHLPLVVGVGCLGVLAIESPRTRPAAIPMDFLRALSAQTALALERARLAREADRARVQADTERARSAVLSSVSHDLRTPLAAITGAATSLAEESGGLPAEDQRLLAQTIAEEAQRLDRQIENLLDMTRVVSGPLPLDRDWHSIEELVGSALRRLGRGLAARAIRVDIADGLPLVHLDSALFEVVIANLVENAHKYSPPDTLIEISAAVAEGSLRLDVVDRGPGLLPGEEERIFEKFHRGARSTGTPGSGLGLPIARGVVEAHGGRLEAATRPDGGARFTMWLPLLGAPPDVSAELAAGAVREDGS